MAKKEIVKKEIRVTFNLENENEKALYEHLIKRTSASGYLKDLALDMMEYRFNQNNDIVGKLERIISSCNSDIKTGSSKESSKECSKKGINNDINNVNLDDIDFSDILNK